MRHLCKNWMTACLSLAGFALLSVAITGCNPPVDEPATDKPEVDTAVDDTASTEGDVTGEITADGTTPAYDAATPNASPEDAEASTAKPKDPLDTTETTGGVKTGEPEDPVSFK